MSSIAKRMNRGSQVVSPVAFHKQLPRLKTELGNLIDNAESLSLPAELQLADAVHRVRVQLHPALRLIVERTGHRLSEALTRTANAHARYRRLLGTFLVEVELSESSACPEFVLQLSSGDGGSGDSRATKPSRRRTVAESPQDSEGLTRQTRLLTTETLQSERVTRLVDESSNVGARAPQFDPAAFQLEISGNDGETIAPLDLPLISVGRRLSGLDGRAAYLQLEAPDSMSRLQLVMRWVGEDAAWEVWNVGLNAIRVGDELVPGAAAESVDLHSIESRHHRRLSIGVSVLLPGGVSIGLRQVVA